jgi:hypothetical protein
MSRMNLKFSKKVSTSVFSIFVWFRVKFHVNSQQRQQFSCKKRDIVRYTVQIDVQFRTVFIPHIRDLRKKVLETLQAISTCSDNVRNVSRLLLGLALPQEFRVTVATVDLHNLSFIYKP